ncbi:MAG TPA: (2Fe-2S)-binding protein [Acidimicrobiales bacterium]|nr:(2Fe-2S)-binding protein [Acidimicrobiales bacterium]
MRRLTLVVNGRSRAVEARDEDLLLDVLREQVGVTSVREGCGVGACGACTVLVAGASVSSCLALAADYDGAEILTVEGLGEEDPVVAAFVAAGALQCGYCIPGFVMMTHELLSERPSPSPAEIREHLAGNLCRCGTYFEITEAVAAAARRRGGG